MCTNVKFTVANEPEAAGTVTNMSEGGMFVESGAIAGVGQRLVAYPDELGRVAGNVVRVSDAGFAVQFDISKYDRLVLERRIEAYLLGLPYLRLADRRAHVRFPLSLEATARIVPSGREFKCTITDISRVGAFVQANNRPSLFSEIKIGGITGRVCRLTRDGFAIKFERTYCRPSAKPPVRNINQSMTGMSAPQR
jgi:hypothetical protein